MHLNYEVLVMFLAKKRGVIPPFHLNEGYVIFEF